ncbi:MAG: serine/threonine-protein kinase, partial [Planctomycetota bacterium]
RLADKGAMSERLTWNLILQTVSGLLYARQHNVVHRDIKPQNLFLLDRPPGSSLPVGVPLLKIADFGLAASIERSSDDTSLTLEGNVVGTPIYMSPEQTSDSHVDHRADIYSVGATAYHMLAGAPMYAGESLMRVLLKKQNAEPKRLVEEVPDVSKQSSDLIFDMMALDPRDRPQEYEQVIERIEEILKTASTQSVGIHSSDADGQDTLEFESGFETHGDSLDRAVLNRAPSRFGRWIAISILVTCISLTAFAVGVTLFQPERDLRSSEMDFSGLATPLFDGASIKGWNSRGGVLDAKLDYEGVGVLEVSGTADHEFPGYTYFLLTAGINLLESASAKTQLLAPDGRPIVEIEISRTHIAVWNDGKLTQSPLSKDPWKDATMDEPVYRELRIDAEPFRWKVSFDGNDVAILPKPSTMPKRLRLVTDDSCHIEGLQVAETISLTAKP